MAALERYFAGERVSFDLDVDAYAVAHGFTDFERDVYAALARVPHGEAVSYRDLAREAGLAPTPIVPSARRWRATRSR